MSEQHRSAKLLRVMLSKWFEIAFLSDSISIEVACLNQPLECNLEKQFAIFGEYFSLIMCFGPNKLLK